MSSASPKPLAGRVRPYEVSRGRSRRDPSVERPKTRGRGNSTLSFYTASTGPCKKKSSVCPTMYVGTRRRESDSRLIVRLTEALEKRDTLIPCLACDGAGTRIVEYPDGGYRQIGCKWCQHGFTDKVTAAMFVRWRRIRKANKCGGLTPSRPPPGDAQEP